MPSGGSLISAFLKRMKGKVFSNIRNIGMIYRRENVRVFCEKSVWIRRGNEDE